MHGQWLGHYPGEQKGFTVLDIDEREGFYSGSAFLWNDDTEPATFATFRTADAGPKHTLNIKLFAVNPYTSDEIPRHLIQQVYPDVEGFAEGAIVNLEWADHQLRFRSTTTLGTTAEGSLVVTDPSSKSDLVPDPNVQTWKQFKDYATDLERNRYIFRGQPSTHRLRTSFHRTNRKDLIRFINDDVPRLNSVLASSTKHLFNTNDPLQNAAFWNLIQHHGYPTPLLDWSYSPFVAAFFAYRFKRSRLNDDCQDVRIFQFDKDAWNLRHPPRLRVAPAPPHLSVLEPLAIENRRAVPQQAVSTVTNVDNIEIYISGQERIEGVNYLRVFDLPCAEYEKVMSELALMNITAGSLFPGLDGTCEEWRNRQFGYGI